MITHGLPECIIQRGKAKSVWLAEAVIAGAGGGRVSYCPEPSDLDPTLTPVFIGVHPTTCPALNVVHNQRRPFVAIDNGYFRPYREGGYFRATFNAMQWIGRYDGARTLWGHPTDNTDAAERLDALNLDVSQWREPGAGSHVLLVLQSPAWIEMMSWHEPRWWVDNLTGLLRRATGREVLVRPKPTKASPATASLDAMMDDAYAVVAYSSTVLLRAALRGIPARAMEPCAATPFDRLQYDGSIRDPACDRLPVFRALAANQWTLDEIAGGRMWRDLLSTYHPEFERLA